MKDKDMPLVKLETFTVATAPDAKDYPHRMIVVTDGDAGSHSLAYSDGTDWKVVALGSTIAATS